MPPWRLSHSFLLVSVSPRSHPVNILWLREYLKNIEYAVPISDRLRSARTFQSLTVWDGHSSDVISMPITRTPLARHLASATHNRNAAASSLPIELLSEIFQVGLAGYPPHELRSIKYLGVISSTCWVWRGAALGTPFLWRCITYEDKDCNPSPKHRIPTIRKNV